MKIMSWNVRGLESPNCKFIVKSFINRLSIPTCLMLQEIKVTSFALDIVLDHIWKDAFKIVSNHPKGKGGVALLLHPRWSNHIYDSGISSCNRVAWVVLKDNNFSFESCLVYASNNYRERSQLWDWMISLPNIPWILGGDFNMIDSDQNKSGGAPFEWKGSEKSFLDRLKQHFNLFDPFYDHASDNSSLKYTWCNFQQGINLI